MKNHLKDMYDYLVENQCDDVCVYDLSKEEQNCDFIYVATAKDVAHNKALALDVMKNFDMEKYPEGYHKGEWIIFDLGQCVVHLFVGVAREKYNLDKLWKSKKVAL
ncbi:MAG: ribosome silencing factor [Clostridia bacterium]|nr:ribosome silencing factor [Clostridia bacterium]